ncbi:MAG: amidohydrolase [Myxococcota bacterium]|nr:amidohydrolase [Myxococcota bacterium]
MKQILLSALVLFTSCSVEAPPVAETTTGTVLYTNARIYTLNLDGPWAQAMVTQGPEIEFVGSEKRARALAGETALEVDLNGAFVLPGFIDTHTHPGLVGILQVHEHESLAGQKLPTTSKDELYAFLEEYSASHFWQPLVMLGEWDVQMFLPDGPTKEDLDRYFKYKPALLFDNSGHSMWMNSMALWLLGIDESTPDLSPGISYFVRDELGEPTGWVKEWAAMPYLQKYMVPSKAELKEGIKEYLDFLSEQGVTTLMDAGNFSSHEEVYAALSELDRDGALPVRYIGSFHVWAPEHLDVAIEELLALREKYGSDRLVFETIKIHFDGVHEILTGGELEPYATAPDVRGGVLFEAEKLARFIAELNPVGLNLHLHTVGAWATREALDAVEQARRKLGELDIEVALSHLEYVTAEDIPRFAELDVHANFTPHWFGGSVFGNAGAYNLGPERSSRSQVVGGFLRAGANITLSSDVVSEAESYRAAPFLGMQMSVTRREYDDPTGPVLSPASASLDLQGAIEAYTLSGARQLGQESRLGSLEAGKRSDFVVLADDPFEVDINRLHELVPRAVVVGGVVESGAL